MSDVPQGDGWWQASDGKWYPPTQAPGETSAPAGVGATYDAGGAAAAAPTAQAGAQPPGPGWWMASDGNWYPPQQGGAPGAYPAPYVAGNPANADPLAKSKMVAGLLGVLLGAFGVHRFYLGYTSIGIIQIVVTIVTCGIGGLWGVVEGILILVGHDSFKTDAEGRPLKD
jgi:TM2 domain-containing membrane protein YozV